MNAAGFYAPDWPVPPAVRAAMTTRMGGISRGPHAAFNLAAHVGDDAAAVAANRRRLRELLDLPAEPAWLQQVHGCAVARLPEPVPDAADAAVAFGPGAVCAVLVADCLPVLLASRDADTVRLVAWLGPAIGPQAFEVGAEVRAACTEGDPHAAAHFRPGRAGRWLADLPALARRRLAICGVGSVHGGTDCTVADPGRFYSYRRDGVTGRMAALVWLA